MLSAGCVGRQNVDGTRMATEDRRLKVKDKQGRVGAVAATISREYCTVQFVKDGYYKVCKIDDLEPVSEDEFKRKFR